MGDSSSASAIEIVGFLGGATIALSLAPQVYKTWTTKSAKDISYAYQAVYMVGCTLVNIYAILEGLWPVFIPCLIEESLIITLTILKVVYDRRPPAIKDEIDESIQGTDLNDLERAAIREKPRQLKSQTTSTTLAPPQPSSLSDGELEPKC